MSRVNIASGGIPRLSAVPGRRPNESKINRTFLLFVYNTTMRRSDELHMGGASRDLQQHYTRYRHRFTLLCVWFALLRRVPCTHSTVAVVELACACLLESPGEAQSSLLCRVNRQVRGGGSGVEKHLLSSLRLQTVCKIFMNSNPIFNSWSFVFNSHSMYLHLALSGRVRH